MRTNEYYSKKRIALLITGAVTIYSILSAMSVIYVKEKSHNTDTLQFTPNFDKNYKASIVLSTTDKTKEDTKPKYSLSTVAYDVNSLYLDWSEIEAERARINKKREEEESNRKAQEALDIQSIKTTVRVQTTLKNVVGSLSLPDILDTSFKGYMSMYKITSKSSKQWEFLRSGKFELTANPDGIMMYDDYYIVAMGSYYTNYKVGSTFRITLDSGVMFNVITGDEKADVDTDSTRSYRPKGPDRGEIIEFIVAYGDEKVYSDGYTTITDSNRRLGDLSSLGFQGNVIKIEKLDDTSVSDELY